MSDFKSDFKGFHLKDPNLKTRLAAHNNGQSVHPLRYKPRELINYIAFKERSMAFEFE